MDHKNIWAILGIPLTTDPKQIRQAYAAKARTVHPEEHPEEFMELQNAYQQALHFAQNLRHHKEENELSSPKSIDHDHQSEIPPVMTERNTQKQIQTAQPPILEEAQELETYFTQADAKYRQNQKDLIEQTIHNIETLFRQKKASDQEWNVILNQKGVDEIAIRGDFMIALCDAMQKMGEIPFHAIVALSFFYQHLQDSTHDDYIPFPIVLEELDRQNQMYNANSRKRGNRILLIIFIVFFLLMLMVSIFLNQPFFIGSYFFVVVIFLYSHLLQKAQGDKKKQRRLGYALLAFILFYLVIMVFISIHTKPR